MENIVYNLLRTYVLDGYNINEWVYYGEEEKENEITIRSSAAEYLTFIAAAGDSKSSVEMRYEDENIWLTQKMMAELYDVSIAAINQHIKKIFDDHELEPEAVIKKYLITTHD